MYLDELDKKILEMLKEDSRTPLTEIAKKTKVSQTTIKNRIVLMKKRGIIKKFSLCLDHEKLGKKLMSLIEIKTDPAKIQEVILELKQISEITEIYVITGEYDIVAKALTEDISTYRDLVFLKIQKIKDLIEFKSNIVIWEED